MTSSTLSIFTNGALLQNYDQSIYREPVFFRPLVLNSLDDQLFDLAARVLKQNGLMSLDDCVELTVWYEVRAAAQVEIVQPILPEALPIAPFTASLLAPFIASHRIDHNGRRYLMEYRLQDTLQTKEWSYDDRAEILFGIGKNYARSNALTVPETCYLFLRARDISTCVMILSKVEPFDKDRHVDHSDITGSDAHAMRACMNMIVLRLVSCDQTYTSNLTHVMMTNAWSYYTLEKFLLLVDVIVEFSETLNANRYVYDELAIILIRLLRRSAGHIWRQQLNTIASLYQRCCRSHPVSWGLTLPLQILLTRNDVKRGCDHMLRRVRLMQGHDLPSDTRWLDIIDVNLALRDLPSIMISMLDEAMRNELNLLDLLDGETIDDLYSYCHIFDSTIFLKSMKLVSGMGKYSHYAPVVITAAPETRVNDADRETIDLPTVRERTLERFARPRQTVRCPTQPANTQGKYDTSSRVAHHVRVIIHEYVSAAKQRFQTKAFNITSIVLHSSLRRTSDGTRDISEAYLYGRWLNEGFYGLLLQNSPHYIQMIQSILCAIEHM